VAKSRLVDNDNAVGEEAVMRRRDGADATVEKRR